MTDHKLKWGVLTTLVALCAIAGAARAAEPFVLEGYEGMAPRLLSEGRYEEVIAQGSKAAFVDSVRANRSITNLCVAYTKTGRLEPARASCDAAITAARRQTGAATWSANERWLTMARAYSNRAVLNWVSGDWKAARADLATAARFAPRAHFVVRNERALAARGEGGTAVAAIAGP